MSVNQVNPNENSIKEFLQGYQGDAKPSVAPKAKNELQKDDFTKLMLSQLKYQDPMNPMDNRQMAQQMAEMASIEQLKNLNAGVDGLRQDQKPIGRMNLLGLIGQEVEAEVGRVDHVKGNSQEVALPLPMNASHMEVEVINGAGETLFTKKASVDGESTYNFKWDGKNKDGIVADTGTYYVRAKVQDKSGKALPYNSISKGKIAGLDFKGDKNILILENGNKVEFSQVKSIGVATPDSQAANKVKTVDPTRPMKHVNGELINVDDKEVEAKGSDSTNRGGFGV